MTKSAKPVILRNDKVNIKYVVHCADIHIRKREREQEYLEVFENFCNDLKLKKLTNKNSVIVVCGDILHDKTELHPISVSLVKEFFIMLCSITEVIVISGNHDISLSNHQHNSLESVIKSLETKHKLHFLLDKGLYEYNNLIFGHTPFGKDAMVVDCNEKKYKNKIKCALYHGIISTAVDEKNRKYISTENNKYLSCGDFSDYDYVFLGDIHKHSFLKPNIAYPGSLIQQSIDESLKKGYILWNLETKKATFCKVQNSYGKLKIKIDVMGKSDIDIKSLPKNMDINIECMSMNRGDIDKIYERMEKNKIKINKKFDIMISDKNKVDTNIKIGDKVQDLTLIKKKDDIIKLLIEKIKDKYTTDNEDDLLYMKNPHF